MHRIGGIEKDIRTGNISYDPQNHQAMTNLRADKVAAVAKFIPQQTVEHGPNRADRRRWLGLDVWRDLSGRARDPGAANA